MKKLTRTGAVLLIMAATLLVYWPALRNGFVWDDTALVLRDPLIRSWRLIPEGFRHFLFLDATASNFYRPIQRLSFVFDYQVYGFDPAVGLASNQHPDSYWRRCGAVLLCGTTAVRDGGAPGPRGRGLHIAFGVALLWTIHPLHTSAVTYVAGRADPLAAFFGFSGLALGLSGLKGQRHSWLSNLGAIVCFLLAALSKESGMIFLPLWLLILAWRTEARRALIPWVLIAGVIVIGYSALRFTAEKVPPPQAPPSPAAIRPILAARAFAGYAGLLVAPVTLRMERDVTTRPLDTPEATFRQARALEYQTLAGVLLLIGFVWWMRYCFRREPAVALCLAAFGVAYLPISNLFPLNATIAEHWLYVPSAFLFLAAFSTARLVLRREEPPHYTATVRLLLRDLSGLDGGARLPHFSAPAGLA